MNILIGAHFDHIDLVAPNLVQDLHSIQVHPGADDNASGTSGLLELAQKLSANVNNLKRSILLVGFDAEEKGLLGSNHFIEYSPIDLKKITTMINMDMIGRLSDSTLTVGGVGTSPSFKYILDSLRKQLFNLAMNKPGFGSLIMPLSTLKTSLFYSFFLVFIMIITHRMIPGKE